MEGGRIDTREDDEGEFQLKSGVARERARVRRKRRNPETALNANPIPARGSKWRIVATALSDRDNPINLRSSAAIAPKSSARPSTCTDSIAA